MKVYFSIQTAQQSDAMVGTYKDVEEANTVVVKFLLRKEHYWNIKSPKEGRIDNIMSWT